MFIILVFMVILENIIIENSENRLFIVVCVKIIYCYNMYYRKGLKIIFG